MKQPIVSTVTMNLWEILILFFAFQAVIFGIIFLLKKRGNRTAHILWGIFLLLFAYNIFYNVLFWSKISPSLLLSIQGSYILCMSLYGPLFYLYVRSLVTNKSLKKKDLLHLFLFIAALYNGGGYLIKSFSTKVEMLNSGQLGNQFILGQEFEKVLSGCMILYGIGALFTLKKNAKIKDRNLRIWLRTITYTYMAFCIAFLSYYVLVHFQVLKTEHDYAITLVMIFFIAITTYVGFEFPEILNGKPVKELIPFVKYERTGLSKRHSLEWKNQLENYMLTHKPYLDSELRLDDLSNALGFSRHHTSQIINEHYGANFFEYINAHRIREANTLLKSTNHHNLRIAEIAYQVGFNNRTSFYTAFKKLHGITPTEYRKNNLRISDNGISQK